jgi:hypothetical protein
VGIALRPCADAPYMRRFAVSVRVSTAVNDERGWLVRPARLHMKLARYLFRWIVQRSSLRTGTVMISSQADYTRRRRGALSSDHGCLGQPHRSPRSAAMSQAQPGSDCGKIPRPSPVLALASRSALGPVSTLFRVLHRVQVTADQADNRPGLQTGRLATCKPFVINNSKGCGQGILPKMRGEKAGL